MSSSCSPKSRRTSFSCASTTLQREPRPLTVHDGVTGPYHPIGLAPTGYGSAFERERAVRRSTAALVGRDDDAGSRRLGAHELERRGRAAFAEEALARTEREWKDDEVH